MTYLFAFLRRPREKRPFHWFLAVGFGALLGVAAGYNFRGSVSIVDGLSMHPTFPPGSYVFTAPISSTLQRGDIVLVDDHSDDLALKRIIGLPGETVHLWRGYVFVNRRLLVEPYLPKYTFTFPDQRVPASRFQLGPDEYFVLGDNRLYSLDSRSFGPVERKSIKSRVPEPENTLRPTLGPYTLPRSGQMLIQPVTSTL